MISMMNVIVTCILLRELLNIIDKFGNLESEGTRESYPVIEYS